MKFDRLLPEVGAMAGEAPSLPIGAPTGIPNTVTQN